MTSTPLIKTEDPWDYVDISEFGDPASEEIKVDTDEREDYFAENLASTVKETRSVAEFLLKHAPDKVLAISNAALEAYRGKLASIYSTEGVTREEQNDIISSLKDSDLLVGPSSDDIQKLEDELAQKLKDIETLKSFLTEEEDKIDDIFKKDAEERSKNLSEMEAYLTQLETELAENLTNPKFDKDLAKDAIDGVEAELELLREREESQHLSSDDIYDMRFLNDTKAEISKLQSEVDDLEAKLADLTFEASPANAWDYPQHLELCSVKTEAVIRYFESRDDIIAMDALQEMNDKMTDELAVQFKTYTLEAKRAQENGDLDSAIENLKHANEIKKAFPEVEFKKEIKDPTESEEIQSGGYEELDPSVEEEPSAEEDIVGKELLPQEPTEEKEDIVKKEGSSSYDDENPPAKETTDEDKNSGGYEEINPSVKKEPSGAEEIELSQEPTEKNEDIVKKEESSSYDDKNPPAKETTQAEIKKNSGGDEKLNPSVEKEPSAEEEIVEKVSLQEPGDVSNNKPEQKRSGFTGFLKGLFKSPK